MPRERPEEYEAAVAVAETVGGTIVQRDVPGAPDGTHDYDVLIGDHMITLEITSAADGETAACGKRLPNVIGWNLPWVVRGV